MSGNAYFLWLSTDSMGQNLSWEANTILSSHEIPRILRKAEVHYRLHKVRHLFLSWARLIQFMPLSHFWRSVLVLSYPLRPGLRIGALPQSSPPKLCIFRCCVDGIWYYLRILNNLFITSLIISPVFNYGSVTIENRIHMIFLNYLHKSTEQSAKLTLFEMETFSCINFQW